MNICIFTGPTISPADAAKILDAEYLPPAAIGDLYRVAQRGPWAIGIIDGFFESTPSVWHKEVLWAMARGIHVFGASSMGALRAAELAPFGMIGVGTIFEAYRDGKIEDDDEVAVVHGPPELGYVQVSEALVNIRATLHRAASTAVISAPTADVLIRLAKSIYYKQRSYDRLLAQAAEQNLPADELAALAAWLPGNQVNQKRLDAVAMLEAIDRQRATDPQPKLTAYKFEHTMLWDAVEKQFGSGEPPGDERQDGAPEVDLVEELRLDPPLYQRTRSDSLLRALIRSEAGQQGIEPTVSELQAATRQFATKLDVQTPAQLEAWLRQQHLSRDEFLLLMGDLARRQALAESLAADADRALVAELQASGEYARLRERARQKQQVLATRGATEPDLPGSGLTDRQLAEWLIRECAPEARGQNLAELAEQLGFGDARTLRRTALREYCYRLWIDP